MGPNLFLSSIHFLSLGDWFPKLDAPTMMYWATTGPNAMRLEVTTVKIMGQINIPTFKSKCLAQTFCHSNRNLVNTR